MVEVTQEDREAAANLFAGTFDDGSLGFIVDQYRAGEQDGDDFVQAFAAHRLAAEARAAKLAEHERLKLVAELKASMGRLMNARFDLEAGATKAEVVRRLGEYIALTHATLDAYNAEAQNG